MEEEYDPILARRAREAKQSKTRTLTILVVVLAVIALGLGGVLFYMWNKYNGQGAEADKALIKSELLETRTLLDDKIAEASNLSIDNEYLTSQLDTAKMQVDALLERLEKTEAKNRSQIESYKRELATLRSIMRGYVTQLDSLNTLNQQLIAENKETKGKLRESEKKNQDLTKKVEELTERNVIGAKLKARGIDVDGEKKNGRSTDRHKDVYRLAVSLTLLENDLAPKGDVTVYVRVFDPEEVMLINGTSTGFEIDGQAYAATAARTVDYTGLELPVTIYVNDIEEYIKGSYRVEVYSDTGKLGETSFFLR